MNYLEGLFLPIFVGLKRSYNIYIIQFSWASTEKVAHLSRVCESAGITYAHFHVQRRPHPLLGSLITLYKGTKFLQDFVRQHQINIVMPRSTFPAAMVLNVLHKHSHLKMIFDADGLPLEERVDFSGLNPRGFQYKLLKSFETKAIERADVVITRTNATVEFLANNMPAIKSKFFTVSNGRDINFFKDNHTRSVVRSSLGIPEEALMLVYAGSLGPQYCVSEMMHIYQEVASQMNNVYLLILTGNTAYLDNSAFTKFIDERVLVKSVPFQEVPSYLAAADVALAIRQPSFSMKGVAPIKIGEYLLTGLPVVASAGIGDTEAILKNKSCCFVLKNHKQESLQSAASWIGEVYNKSTLKEEARALGIKEFSLENSIKTYTMALRNLN